MLFQYPSGQPGSGVADILIWIMIVVAAVAAFFLLVEYINTHQTHHLLWAGAFIGIWIVFHQVTLLGTFGVAMDSLGAGISVFSSGAIATGLLYAVFGKEKKLLGRIPIGMAWLIVTLIMSVVVGLFGLSIIRSTWFSDGLPYWPVAVIEMIVYTANAVIIVGLPIYTTLKTKETEKSAYIISAGGLLWTIAGIFWSLMYTIGDDLAVILVTILVYPIVFGTFCYVFGMLYEKKWRFDIPGIEFED